MLGHATAIGKRTRKCLGYEIRAKACRVCRVAKRKGKPPKVHKCVHTWNGSSKAMEPDMVVGIVKKANEHGVKVSTLVGDEDSTTIARARKEVDATLKKGSDLNHLLKGLGNQLFDLKKKHKAMSVTVIKYFQSNFAIAICQNEGNEEEIASRMKQIVPHSFGDHTKCGDWCGFKKDPKGYRHQHLPRGGQDLIGEQMKKDLMKIFDGKASQAGKYVNIGSTQANESLNMTVSSKAPKRINYSESTSLQSRVEAAVAQKNLGHGYIAKVSSPILGMIRSSACCLLTEPACHLDMQRCGHFKQVQLEHYNTAN